MPPKPIDEIIDPTQLFYSYGDGNYVPFARIQEAVTTLENQFDPGVIHPAFTETGEMYMTLTLTNQSARRWRKTIHAFNNRLKRDHRKAIRQKEKQRRKRLKEERA